LSDGFLYAVTSSSTTGGENKMPDVTGYLEKLKKMKLKNPVLAGFGIRDKNGFEEVCKHANGAIIGSAFIKAIQQGPFVTPRDVNAATKSFLSSITG